VHLVGFAIEIYHDARSYERQTSGVVVVTASFTATLMIWYIC